MNKITCKVYSIWALLFLTSCSLFHAKDSKRTPDSQLKPIVINRDLLVATQSLKSFLNGNELSVETCPDYFNQLHKQMFSMDPQYFDQDKLKKDSHEIVQNLWEARLTIREKASVWIDRNLMTTECRDALRTGFRTSRVLEDYLLSMRLGNPSVRLDEKSKMTKALEGGENYFLLNPRYKEYSPKSGDIFLSRGTALTSAAIARISETDTNFSHLAIMYVDPKTNKPYMVEAHIEVGSKVAPFSEYQADGKARAAIFRLPDEKLAASAAEKIYRKVWTAQQNKENIPYDFGMDMASPKELFCSEVVSYAYELASNGQFKIPLFSSGITMKNDQFLRDIGVKVKSTFAPADIELDTRFEFIGEWRDVKQIHHMHMADMILTKTYEWMNDLGYKFYESPAVAMGKYALWTGRHLPPFSGLLKTHFPKNMSASAIGAMMSLNGTGEILMDKLEAKNIEIEKDTGYRMTVKQMADFLEDYRQMDLVRYKESGQSELHWRFRSPKDSTQPPPANF